MAKSEAGTKILFGGGIFLVIFSCGLIVTYIAELVTGTTRHGVASQLGLITFLGGLTFAGYKMVHVHLREEKALKELQEEQAILSRAKAQGGALTVSDTALNCNLRISDTKKAFERLALTSVCRVDVNEEGELFYRFPTFEAKQISQSMGEML